MTAQVHNTISRESAPITVGALVVAFAGAGLSAYGLLFLFRNFNGFIELGITPALLGTTAEELFRANPQLYHYISHIQVALAGFMIGLGLSVIALAWFGIRQRVRWALWTAFLAPVVAVGVALPLHYPYGFDTIGHLGLIYLDGFILLVGTVLSYTALQRFASE
jgi:hypothetical protein